MATIFSSKKNPNRPDRTIDTYIGSGFSIGDGEERVSNLNFLRSTEDFENGVRYYLLPSDYSETEFYKF